MDVIEPVQPKEAVDTDSSAPSLTSQESPMFAQIQGLFGITQADSTERQMLNEVYDALRTEDNTEAGMLWKISQLESRIGLPPLGVNRLTHLHGFIKLQRQLNTLEAQLSDIYGR